MALRMPTGKEFMEALWLAIGFIVLTPIIAPMISGILPDFALGPVTLAATLAGAVAIIVTKMILAQFTKR